MDKQAQVFATKKTYLYYTRYYDMLNKMDALRRCLRPRRRTCTTRATTTCSTRWTRCAGRTRSQTSTKRSRTRSSSARSAPADPCTSAPSIRCWARERSPDSSMRCACSSETHSLCTECESCVFVHMTLWEHLSLRPVYPC